MCARRCADDQARYLDRGSRHRDCHTLSICVPQHARHCPPRGASDAFHGGSARIRVSCCPSAARFQYLPETLSQISVPWSVSRVVSPAPLADLKRGVACTSARCCLCAAIALRGGACRVTGPQLDGSAPGSIQSAIKPAAPTYLCTVLVQRGCMDSSSSTARGTAISTTPRRCFAFHSGNVNSSARVPRVGCTY